MMKRLVSFLFFFSLIVLVTGLIAPSFINWNDYKDDILQYISPYLQRKVDVEGRISFRVLPQPEIMLEDVTVANGPDGSKTSSFMSLRQLEMRIKMEPLLEGRVEVEALRL